MTQSHSVLVTQNTRNTSNSVDFKFVLVIPHATPTLPLRSQFVWSCTIHVGAALSCRQEPVGILAQQSFHTNVAQLSRYTSLSLFLHTLASSSKTGLSLPLVMYLTAAAHNDSQYLSVSGAMCATLVAVIQVTAPTKPDTEDTPQPTGPSTHKPGPCS